MGRFPCPLVVLLLLIVSLHERLTASTPSASHASIQRTTDGCSSTHLREPPHPGSAESRNQERADRRRNHRSAAARLLVRCQIPDGNQAALSRSERAVGSSLGTSCQIER